MRITVCIHSQGIFGLENPKSMLFVGWAKVHTTTRPHKKNKITVNQERALIRHCHICNQYFGTARGYGLHLGKRGCKASKVLSREGLWRGYAGVWWTKDLGHDDTPYDWYEVLLPNPELEEIEELPILNT